MATSSRDKGDFFTQEAKKRGYPARSIFKLEEIVKKFPIFKSSTKILDVGAAPGSWSLYISRELLKGKGQIVSADLNSLSLNPMPANIAEVVGDAFAPENLNKILAFGVFDAIVSDAAPHTTGNRLTDTSRSSELVRSVIELSDSALRPKGNLVAKIFQGEGFEKCLKMLKARFEKVTTFKPNASRNDSFETFLIALTKKSN